MILPLTTQTPTGDTRRNTRGVLVSRNHVIYTTQRSGAQHEQPSPATTAAAVQAPTGSAGPGAWDHPAAMRHLRGAVQRRRSAQAAVPAALAGCGGASRNHLQQQAAATQIASAAHSGPLLDFLGPPAAAPSAAPQLQRRFLARLGTSPGPVLQCVSLALPGAPPLPLQLPPAGGAVYIGNGGGRLPLLWGEYSHRAKVVPLLVVALYCNRTMPG